MNVSVETLPNCLATLRVEVGPDRIAKTREALVSEYLKGVKVPGFRPGKVPRPLVEKRFHKEITEELESRMVSTALDEAIDQKGLRVIQVQAVEDVKLAPAEGCSFSATVVTVPEFELPSYKGLAVKVPSEAVKDSEVDEALQHLRERMADFVDLKEDRGVQMGDFIVTDYSGTVDGVPVHEKFPKVGPVLSRNEGFWIRMTEEAFFPGFCAQLLGGKAGESRSFEVTVPEDFPVEGFGGQKLRYEVTIKEVKERVLPELDDKFAASMAEGKSLTELRDLVRADLGVQKTRRIRDLKREQVMEALLSQVECELPEGMARAESGRVLQELVRENQARGATEDMLRSNEKELVASASQTARNRLKSSFILSKIAEQEKIGVSREELFNQIAALAQSAQVPLQKMLKDVSKRRLLPQIQSEIRTAKALEVVVSEAAVTVDEADAESSEKPKDA
jgi:trigger factor